MVYDHHWNMNVSCAEQFAKIKTVDDIWINGSNDVVDVRPFANLPNLKKLAIPKNKVKDISPLVSSPNLESLTLWSNEIVDLTPIASLKNLKSIGFANNKITDASPLAELPGLLGVSLEGNKLASTDFLKALPNLVYLNLSEADITSLPDLSHLTKLETLKLEFNKLTSVPGLSNLTSVREIDLGWNEGLTKIESLKKLEGLRVFSAWDCSLTAAPELPAKLDNSSAWPFQLSLGGNKISDISALANFNYQINLKDISVLATVKAFGELDLSKNQIEDLSPLSNKWIGNLNASNNRISHLENFIPDQYIGEIWLNDNQISSIAPLPSILPNLRAFAISNNPVVDVEKIGLMNPDKLPSVWMAGLGLKNLNFLSDIFFLYTKGIDVSNNDLTDVSPLMNSVIAEFIRIGCNPNLPQDQAEALKKRHNTSGRMIVSTNCN